MIFCCNHTSFLVQPPFFILFYVFKTNTSSLHEQCGPGARLLHQNTHKELLFYHLFLKDTQMKMSVRMSCILDSLFTGRSPR